MRNVSTIKSCVTSSSPNINLYIVFDVYAFSDFVFVVIMFLFMDSSYEFLSGKINDLSCLKLFHSPILYIFL